eukprot:scaffold82007_cov48-Phaeocystis_antarctica.AAC.2
MHTARACPQEGRLGVVMSGSSIVANRFIFHRDHTCDEGGWCLFFTPRILYGARPSKLYRPVFNYTRPH